jgi:hypothetical protein
MIARSKRLVMNFVPSEGDCLMPYPNAPADGGIEEAVKHLSRHVDITRDVRYAIARRLRREKACARVVVSLLSLVIIGFAIAFLVFSEDFTHTQIAAVSVLNILVSSYIIVMNYEFERRDFDRQIMILEKSTSQLRELHYALTNNQVWTKAALQKYTETYNAILREFRFQTEERDYDYVMLMHPHKRGENYKALMHPFWIKFGHQSSHWVLAVTWNIMPLILIVGTVIILLKYRT